MPDTIVSNLKAMLPAVDFWSLRCVESEQQNLMVRQDRVEPVNTRHSHGYHLTLVKGYGIAYSASCDFSREGLRLAVKQANNWLAVSSRYPLISGHQYTRPTQSGSWQSSVDIAWESVELADKIDRLKEICLRLHSHQHIVDWWASLDHQHLSSTLYTDDVTIEQQFFRLSPTLSALANSGGESQQRSFGTEYYAQSGLEFLTSILFDEQADRVSEQALQLLDAESCPSGSLDLLLMPSQMAMQIHESIGHPLELDRILGDERNYAGTSFVTEAMFGNYQYGSELLNVVFDPFNQQQVASYAYDDEGSPAKYEYLIKNGILQRPIAGHLSQQRAYMPGVASSLACDWNRPAIDRMANINLQAGDVSLEQIIAGVESGILMDTNRSWSIDDSRNKFQFGCEYAQLIENGALSRVVKNPNYRGISADFWRNLVAVGNQASYQVMGVGACGKGEPNQAVQVGHASPACLFKHVDVFAG